MSAPTEVIAGNLRFLRALVARPRNIGAIAPSSRTLARAMAGQIEHVQAKVIAQGFDDIAQPIILNRIQISNLLHLLCLPKKKKIFSTNAI